jgi:hypothetical protein
MKKLATCPSRLESRVAESSWVRYRLTIFLGGLFKPVNGERQKLWFPAKRGYCLRFSNCFRAGEIGFAAR